MISVIMFDHFCMFLDKKIFFCVYVIYTLEKSSRHKYILTSRHIIYMYMVFCSIFNRYLQIRVWNFDDNLTNHDNKMIENSDQSRQNQIPSVAILTSSDVSLGHPEPCLSIHHKALSRVVATVHETGWHHCYDILAAHFNPSFMANQAIPR